MTGRRGIPRASAASFASGNICKHTELVEGVWSRERVLGGDAEPEVVISGAVSPGVFALFGGSAVMGRTFTEAEDQANAKVVVLSHALWQRRFGGDASLRRHGSCSSIARRTK